MAENKKSFVAYVSWKDTFDALPDDKAGQLVKFLFAYVNDENPKTDDILINAVFANIKQTLKRDLVKYKTIREKRSLAGVASAESRKQNQQVLTSVEYPQQTPTNSTVSVSVSDSVNVSVNDNKEKEIYIESGHLSISWIEMNKLIDEFGRIKADEYVRKVLNYRKNSNYKSLYLTALNWLKRDVTNEPERKTPKLAI